MSQIQRLFSSVIAPLLSVDAGHRSAAICYQLSTRNASPVSVASKRWQRCWLLAALLAGGVTSSAFGASFNCSKAGSATEKIICGDAELSRLDDQLGKTYKQAKMRAADRREFAARSDGFWRWREKNCQTRDCLIDWYQQRQLALDAELAGVAPPPTTLNTLAAKTAVPSAANAESPEKLAQTVTPEQVQSALAQVQKLIAEPAHGNHLFLVAPPAPATGAVPLQAHYIDASGGEYVYEDLNEATAVDARPRVVVRYRGKVHGEYTLEVQKKAGKLRYTCDSDCTYIKQLTLPGYGLHDLDMLKNDHASLASIIMRDAMNGLLTQSD